MRVCRCCVLLVSNVNSELELSTASWKMRQRLIYQSHLWRYPLDASGYLRRCLGTSVIDEEVHKFGAVGKGWWDTTSKAGTGPLHAMNPVRVEFIRRQIAESRFGVGESVRMPPMEQIKGLRILDVGCGGGLASEALARLGAIVTSIDPSAENISIAAEHSRMDPKTSDIRYIHSTVEEFCKNGERFDAVISLEVMEHIDEPELFLGCLRECTKDGGLLFLSTINKTPQSFLKTIIGAELLLNLVPKGTHDWEKYITPMDMSRMLACNGFKDIQYSGIVVDSCRLPTKGIASGIRWKLDEKDLSVNYILKAVAY